MGNGYKNKEEKGIKQYRQEIYYTYLLPVIYYLYVILLISPKPFLRLESSHNT